MLAKRIIVCLDVRDGKVTKGVKFEGNRDLGDPVAMAAEYYRQGVDELVFYDITASAEGRGTDLEMVRAVAREVFIPFAVGGGVRDLSDMRAVLLSGAEKVSVNSLAVRNPSIISDGARAFGNQCVVLGMDVLKVPVSETVPSGYEVVVKGGRERTGLDAVAWARRAEALGAGEICVNSIDADGTKEGYELSVTGAICRAVTIPVIASGGAGRPEHLARVLRPDVGADAALVASLTHIDGYTVERLKAAVAAEGLPVRDGAERGD